MPTIDAVLKAVAPKADPDFVKASVAVNAAAIMIEYGLTGPNEQAQLLGHMAVECGGFRVFAENLNYSAERMVQVFPTRFPSVEAARPFEHNPQAFANKVYGGRYGNTGPNDGFLYRGSGALQHTFKSEFDRVQKRTGMPVVAMPDQLRDKRNAEAIWRAACSYIADKPGALAAAKAGDTLATTKKINGGTNGLADRRTYIARAGTALGGAPILVLKLPIVPPPLAEPPIIEVTPPTTAKIEHADPTQQTTTEVEESERTKRNTSIGGTVAASPAGGGTASQTTKQVDYWLVGGVMVGVALIGFFVIRYFWQRHAAAQAVVETQQLMAVAQRANA